MSLMKEHVHNLIIYRSALYGVFSTSLLYANIDSGFLLFSLQRATWRRVICKSAVDNDFRYSV